MADKIVKSAGRISPTPMGDYDDTTTYRRLDWIQYGGTSYICKKNDTCGINPSDTNHWQKIINLDFLNVAFEEANERQQINSGDNLSTILGKIKKWFVDLKPVAFSGNYADLDGTPDLSVYASESDMVSTKESIQDLKQATDVVIDPYTNSTNVSFSVPSGNNVLPTAEGSRYSLRSAIEESTQGISEEVIKKADKTSLHKVASTGKYSDLSDRLTLTNNDLATVPGTAWDAVRGAEVRKDVDTVTHMVECVSPNSKEEVLALINNSVNLFQKSSMIPFRLHTSDKKLGENIANGNYIGLLEYNNGNVTGFLTNHWNPAQRISIAATLYGNPQQIFIKFENFEFFYDSITQINSDLEQTGILKNGNIYNAYVQTNDYGYASGLSTDLNDYKKVGAYDCTNNFLNTPVSDGWGTVNVFGTVAVITQLFAPWNYSIIGDIYVRTCVNGTWSTWKKLNLI